MLQRRTKPGGGPRTLVALAGMPMLLCSLLAGLSLGSAPAGAQLSDLRVADTLLEPAGPVQQVVEPLQRIVQAPLPSPLEEIVRDSPVEPVRDEVRDIAGSPGSGVAPPDLPRLPGDEPERRDAPGDGNASAAAASAGPGPAAGGPNPRAVDRGSQPPSAGGTGGGLAVAGREPSRGETGDRGRRARDTRPRGADGPRTGVATALEPAAARREGSSTGDGDDGGALARTVNRIVEVVPTAVWIALGVLALLALAFGVRSLIDRRRTRALERERERLLRDMGLLERVLLPQVPERLGDLAASVAYRPAAGPAAGGDFYDVFELPEGRVALVVGDVSGHGREALQRTSALRPTLRGHLEAGLSPRAALESAGRAAGIDQSGGFTTAIVAVHDPSSGALTYAAAGHPPPILVGPGAHEPLTVASAPPIGVGLRTGLRQTTVPLPRGSAACFFTDGLLEARSGGRLLGRDWLAEVVAEFGPLDSAAALMDRVMETADETADDMTACLIRAVAGSEDVGPRVEELQLAPDDVGAAAPERLLAACGVPADAISPLLAEARRLAVQTGGALVTVTIEGGDAAVRVTAPAREALATT